MTDSPTGGDAEARPTSTDIEVTVPPRFCDTQGMVHASRYHEFLEDAFLQWLTDIDLPYPALLDRDVDLVIGTSTIRFLQPGRLHDRLVIRARPTASTASTVTIGFTIARDTVVLAEATVTYIAARSGGSAPLPEELALRG